MLNNRADNPAVPDRTWTHRCRGRVPALDDADEDLSICRSRPRNSDGLRETDTPSSKEIVYELRSDVCVHSGRANEAVCRPPASESEPPLKVCAIVCPGGRWADLGSPARLLTWHLTSLKQASQSNEVKKGCGIALDVSTMHIRWGRVDGERDDGFRECEDG